MMTPLVPASVHLIVSTAAVLSRFTPGAGAAIAGVSDHPEVALSDSEAKRMKSVLLLSRGWYLAGALRSGCELLYSEDFQAGQQIHGLRIIGL